MGSKEGNHFRIKKEMKKEQVLSRFAFYVIDSRVSYFMIIDTILFVYLSRIVL